MSLFACTAHLFRLNTANAYSTWHEGTCKCSGVNTQTMLWCFACIPLACWSNSWAAMPLVMVVLFLNRSTDK